MAESYLQIKGAPGAAPLPAEVQHWLLALHWLELHGDDDWMPVAMLAIARLAEQPGRLAQLLRALDRFAHGLMALGCGREARRKHYAPVLKRLTDARELPPPDSLLALSASNQKVILRNIATRLHMIDGPTAKLVLVRTDQTITGRALASYRDAVERDRRDPERYTVEHVCPKGSAVVDGEWLRLFSRRPHRQRAAECIGNLVLVTEAQNGSGSQQDFAAKRELFFAGGAASPFALTELLRHEATWDGDAIAGRYALIMAAVKEMWSLQGAVPPCPALGNAPPSPRPPSDPPSHDSGDAGLGGRELPRGAVLDAALD